MDRERRPDCRQSQSGLQRLTAAIWLGVALSLGVGCERATPPAHRDAPSAAPVSAASSAVAPHAVRYDCGPLGEVATEPCEAAPPWLGELERYGGYITDQGMTRTTREQCRAALAALRAGVAHDLEALSTEARVLAQNAALRIFISAPKRCDYAGVHGVGPPAARLVQRLALPPAVLNTLGAAPIAELDDWIGQRARWRDMATERPSTKKTLFHDQADKHTRIFRPVRSGDTRAIFSRVIAIDTDWQPRVTSLVAKVELRRGLDDAAPACGAKIDLDRIQCGAHLKVVSDLEKLPISRFFFRVQEGHVGCNQCHIRTANKGANLVPLAADAGGAERDAKTAAVLSKMVEHIRGVRAALE